VDRGLHEFPDRLDRPTQADDRSPARRYKWRGAEPQLEVLRAPKQKWIDHQESTGSISTQNEQTSILAYSELRLMINGFCDRFQNIAIISVIPDMVNAGYRG
jgi:hypothetical protein